MHTIEDVEYTIKAFSEIRRNLEEGKYNTSQIPTIIE
jgi:glycine C-acetyltransferase